MKNGRATISFESPGGFIGTKNTEWLHLWGEINNINLVFLAQDNSAITIINKKVKALFSAQFVNYLRFDCSYHFSFQITSNLDIEN